MVSRSGLVQFEGPSIDGMSQSDLTTMRRRVGFLFQQAALFDTAFDPLALRIDVHYFVPQTIQIVLVGWHVAKVPNTAKLNQDQ